MGDLFRQNESRLRYQTAFAQSIGGSMQRLVAALAVVVVVTPAAAQHSHSHKNEAHFTVQSARSGLWSDPATWTPRRVPGAGDRVLVRSGMTVEYDVASKAVLRLVQVVGTLKFSTTVSTELNVGLLTIRHSEACSEHGFSCEFEAARTGPETRDELWPTLLVGTRETPIPAHLSAKIRLHYVDGLSREDAPAIACCSGRMEIHGAPMSRTWIKLDADVRAGTTEVLTTEAPSGWKVGDEVLLTAAERAGGSGSFRKSARRTKQAQSETRRLVAIDGRTLTLDRPVQFAHRGTGEFRCEIANLSRNVVIESADPQGVRGHTVFHRFSRGGISYARFAHLGKEGVLGRYAIHYHLVGDTMRGSVVQGVAVVDSHNRWVTVHGTEYLIVRDCVGYQSVGHGFFLEDGTEVMNLLDRNLAVQAFRGPRLKEQALPFDPNDGAGFWWANGLNTISRNVSCENDEYGYRYDMQKRSNFDSRLPVRQPDGSETVVDVRTLPIWRFEDNEAHAEGFYGVLIAANGNSQPDTPIRDQKMLDRIRRIDWTAPDIRHPHRIRDLTIWGSHYAFRPHSPAMRMENVRIHNAAYGIYRPAFENHEYVNLHISDVVAEPFNRGMDDASAQTGSITVDGLTFESGYGNRSTPLVQISDVNLSGDAATHFRRVRAVRPTEFADRWPLINRGVGPRVPPLTPGVPVYLHDHFAPGVHAKVVSTAATDLMNDGNTYVKSPPLTGEECRVAEVRDVVWPTLLDPVDDLPPATVITDVRSGEHGLEVRGVSHDNGPIAVVLVNDKPAEIVDAAAGVSDWRIVLPVSADGVVRALAIDEAGNREQTPHQAGAGL